MKAVAVASPRRTKLRTEVLRSNGRAHAAGRKSSPGAISTATALRIYCCASPNGPANAHASRSKTFLLTRHAPQGVMQALPWPWGTGAETGAETTAETAAESSE